MTASECADWWRDLLNQGTDALYAKMEKNGLGADTEIGFQITWRVNVLSSVVDMFVFDPLRLGAGTGMAVGDTRPGFKNGAMRVLNVVSDIGRATVFLPLGKLTRLGRVAVVEDQALAHAIPPSVPPANAPRVGSANAPRVGMPAGGEPPPEILPTEKGLSTASEILERIFRVAPDPARGTNLCTWQALTQALRSTGRWYMRIEDIARLVGIEARPFTISTVYRLEQIYVDSVRHVSLLLNRLGIPCRQIDLGPYRATASIAASALKTIGQPFDEVTSVLKAILMRQSRPGVLMFGVQWTPPGKAVPVGHMLFAKLDEAGNVLIVDRSGFVARNLAGLEEVQSGIGGARLMDAMDGGKPNFGALFIEQASVAESKAALSKAVRQTMDNPLMNATGAGLTGPLAIPIKLHMQISTSPRMPGLRTSLPD
jgi:hypothetical protein